MIILDDAKTGAAPVHTTLTAIALNDALPPRLSPFSSDKVRVKVISTFNENGQRRLTDAMAEVRRLVDAGQVQVVVAVGDYAEDDLTTAKGMSTQLQRPITSLDTLTRADLQSVADRQRQSNPAFSRVLDQVKGLGARVPFFVAAGNEGIGDGLSLATTTINVGATNWRGQREMTAGWFDIYASGLVPGTGPIGPILSRGEGFSSFAAPRAAAKVVKTLGDAAGL